MCHHTGEIHAWSLESEKFILVIVPFSVYYLARTLFLWLRYSTGAQRIKVIFLTVLQASFLILGKELRESLPCSVVS